MLANLRFLSYLCSRNQQMRYSMLGIDSPHTPVEGKFADEIRETMRRMSTGNLNEADKKRIRRSRKVLEKYEAVWK